MPNRLQMYQSLSVPHIPFICIFICLFIPLYVTENELLETLNTDPIYVNCSIPSNILRNDWFNFSDGSVSVNLQPDHLTQQQPPENNPQSDYYFFVRGYCLELENYNTSLELRIGTNVPSAITCSICSNDINKIQAVFFWKIPSRKSTNSNSTSRVKVRKQDTEDKCIRFDLDLLDVFPNDTGNIECIINITNNITKQHITQFRGVRHVSASYSAPQISLLHLPKSVIYGEALPVACMVRIKKRKHSEQNIWLSIAAYQDNHRLQLMMNSSDSCSEYLEGVIDTNKKIRISSDDLLEVNLEGVWSNICVDEFLQSDAQTICNAVGLPNQHPLNLRIPAILLKNGIKCKGQLKFGNFSACQQALHCPEGWLGINCAGWNYILERNHPFQKTFNVSFSTCKSSNNVTVICRVERDLNAFETVDTIWIKPKSLNSMFCKAHLDYYNIFWKETSINQNVTGICPGTTIGFSQRFCNSGGNWESSDYSGCFRKDIKQLLDMVSSPNHIVLTPADILSQLIASLSIEGLIPLTSTDLINSVYILQWIVAQYDDSKFSPEMEVFINVADILLDSNFTQSWKLLNKNIPVNLMRTLENFGKIMARNYVEDQIIRLQNIEFFIKIINKGATFSFPNLGMAGSSLSFSDEFRQVATKDDSIKVSCLFYKTLADILPNHDDIKISSEVMSISVNSNKRIVLQNLLSIRFNNIRQSPSHEPSCSYWKFSNFSAFGGSWSSKGCRVMEYYESNRSVICMCDHMTNFAVLMNPKKLTPFHDALLGTLTIFGCTLSILCLLLTIVTHLCIWKSVASIRTVLLLNLSTSLLLAKFVFLVGITQTSNMDICKFIAILLHYLYLVVFSFMLCHGILLYLLTVKVFNTGINLNLRLSTLGWGLPVLIVGITLAARETKGYGMDEYCWLSKDYGMVYAFIIPVALIIAINASIIIMAIKSLAGHTGTMNDKEKIKTLLWNICLLLPLLGITWIFGFLAILDQSFVFHYLFVLLNSIQGVLIFACYCLRNPKIEQCMIDACRKRNPPFSSVKYALTKMSSDSGTTSTKNTQSDPHRVNSRDNSQQ